MKIDPRDMYSGMQLTDALKISHHMKFEETQFPVKEMILAQPDPAPSSDCQFLKSDNESDSSGLDLVKLVQPPTRPPSPG